jgi:hypothetical protein
MEVTSPTAVGSTIKDLLGHPIAGPPTAEALGHLVELFGRRGAPGIRMQVPNAPEATDNPEGAYRQERRLRLG